MPVWSRSEGSAGIRSVRRRAADAGMAAVMDRVMRSSAVVSGTVESTVTETLHFIFLG